MPRPYLFQIDRQSHPNAREQHARPDAMSIGTLYIRHYFYMIGESVEKQALPAGAEILEAAVWNGAGVLPVPSMAKAVACRLIGIARVGSLLTEHVTLSLACAPRCDASDTAGWVFVLSTSGTALGCKAVRVRHGGDSAVAVIRGRVRATAMSRAARTAAGGIWSMVTASGAIRGPNRRYWPVPGH